MISRPASLLVLIVSLAGCGGVEVGGDSIDYAALCLQEHPGDVRCCGPGGHIDHETCCRPHTHLVRDFEHPDWMLCVWDADVGAMRIDAGADAE